MATVTNNMTRIHDAEGALTTANLPAGGAGATANTDIFLQGAQSLGRRQTNTTDTGGFVLVDAADNNVSASGTHVGMWFWVTHFGILDDVRLILATGTGTPSNYDSHTYPLTEYPKLGGWIRGWVDVARTPEVTGGTGLSDTALRSYGVQISFTAAPGGNAQNLIVDAADFITGAALSLAGTSGAWTDFTTADENSSNQYGVFRTAGGVYNCFARVQLGTSSSLVFNQSNFTIVFPQQALVSDSFMGINVDLQHASTNIDWASGALISSGAKKGDLVVTGTSGDFDAISCSFSNLRIVTLTSVCSVLSSSFQGCGLITQSGAIIDECSISGASGAVAVLSDDPSKITDCSFTSAGTGHAIELTTPGTYTFSGNTFTGYGSAGTTDAAIYNNSGGAVTLNIAGGGSTPTIRNGAGASTTVNNNKSVTFTGMKDNTEVRVYTAGTTTEIAGVENATDGTADNRSFTWSAAAGTNTDYVIHSVAFETIRVEDFTVPSTDSSIPIQQRTDRVFSNP